MCKNEQKRKALLVPKTQNKISVEKEFELREKRLKLTYKILYVVAVGWAVLLLVYMKSVSIEKMICNGILTILTVLLINILSFVFHEFRCLNIFQSTDDKTKELTDHKFQNIWNGFGLSCFISIGLVMLNIAYPTFINTWTIGISMSIGSVLMIIRSCFTIFLPARIKKVKRTADNVFNVIVLPILCYMFFAIDQLA